MAEEQKRSVQLQRVYAKDVSLETPGVPDAFLAEKQPKLDVQLNNGASRIQDGDEFEVSVTATVTATQDEKVAYLVEVTQAAIFTISGFEGEELDHILGSYAPGVVFPYLREVISDLITRASFPPFLLQPINFEALYREARAKREEQEKEQQDSGQKH